MGSLPVKAVILFVLIALLASGSLHAQGPFDKFSLWLDGPKLRGANIWQRIVVPDLDGSDFLGSGHVGPPYTQADLDRLSAGGANYVNVSHPGLFTQDPPYVLDEGVQANLDSLLAMIAHADMFAVISFRTGPGRSDFTFYSDGAGDWFDESLLNDEVWRDQAAQDAWVEMWRYTAERYRGNPIIAGYDLMVEPNGSAVWLDLWEPEDFYPTYAGSLYDWNQLYPRISAAVREVDADTPILIGAMSYSAVNWLPWLQPTGDSRTVYTVHQYEPFVYTHQVAPFDIAYPGTADLDWDGSPEPLDQAYLAELLSTVRDFMQVYQMPVAVNEFGLRRFQPGAAAFIDDELELFEQLGVNYAQWVYNPSWSPYQQNDDFDFTHGPDPTSHAPALSDLLEVIHFYWSRNTLRPSNVGE